MVHNLLQKLNDFVWFLLFLHLFLWHALVLASPSNDGHEETLRIVFIKTYKTGSTSTAELIYQIANKLGLYMLHPEKHGKFEIEELEKLASNGLTYDVSFRHFHPAPLDYSVLSQLFPSATYVTIVRHPVQRFFSMFKFDTGVNKQFRDNPQSLIDAFSQNKYWEKRKWFCNNQARILYSNEEDIDKRERTDPKGLAEDIIQELESNNVIVLVQEYMAESIYYMAQQMGIDLVKMGVKIPNSRKQSYNYDRSCQYNCVKKIEMCANVDMIIFEHFYEKFESILPELDAEGIQVLKKNANSGAKRSRQSGNPYAHNCIPNPKNRNEELQSCKGRPT
mmetsp:Transcript_5100/g.7047  ORF Transcript_5100/g.7047 Transcript_5100/m.7047 type:complete len:335 (-) Transcript_5100:230-1234(-)